MMPWISGGPLELPNGRLVCLEHELVVCPYCCVDYSFMDDILGEDDEGLDEEFDSEGDLDSEDDLPSLEETYSNPFREEPKEGLGRVIPNKFKPPKATDTPQLLFPQRIGVKALPPVHRFIHRNDPSQFLIYTDGACLNNGGANPKAGCAFVYRSPAPQVVGHKAFRLENEGPTGKQHPQTSNRAELRAVIAALRFRFWTGEGFNSLVIATDSEYVVEGATKWVRTWLQNGWKTRLGASVKNKDL